MKYVIIWKGEEIDETDCVKNARYLVNEYNLAYGGGVTMKRQKI